MSCPFNLQHSTPSFAEYILHIIFLDTVHSVHVTCFCCLVSFPNLHGFSLPARATVAGSRVPTVRGRRNPAMLQTSHLEKLKVDPVDSWASRPTYPFFYCFLSLFVGKKWNVKMSLRICFALPQHPKELLLWPREPPCLSSRVCIKSH